MRRIALISILICACALAQAQITNYVKNPSFEIYSNCPIHADQLVYANGWRGTVDSAFEGNAEYFNICSNAIAASQQVPNNPLFYQYPHSGDGMVGATLYYDKTLPSPPSPLPFNYRDYVQSHLFQNLIAGKTYCVSFWVNHTEASGFGQNKIGAYLDNGAINTAVDSAGKEILSVVPQVYSSTVLKDTANWEKIEGSFIALGNEKYITIGNFFSNGGITTVVTNYWGAFYHYSYYLIDDISVIPIDLNADAGKDTWVEQGKKVKIGRVGDTTAMGLDCKWYKKGVLIDSGAIITVNANAIKHAIDTYVVVQTICGIVKRDTVTVFTAGLGLNEIAFDNKFMIYPNPSNGNITISSSIKSNNNITAKVYDLLGREIFHQKLSFTNKQSALKLDVPNGSYILELQDDAGNVQRERIVIQ